MYWNKSLKYKNFCVSFLIILMLQKKFFYLQITIIKNFINVRQNSHKSIYILVFIKNILVFSVDFFMKYVLNYISKLRQNIHSIFLLFFFRLYETFFSSFLCWFLWAGIKTLLHLSKLFVRQNCRNFFSTARTLYNIIIFVQAFA